MERLKIRRALISTHDKEGVLGIGARLQRMGVKILATDGTARFLKEGGVPARTVSDYTGQEELLGGKVKTLHPMVFAAVLAAGGEREEVAPLGIEPVEMVVVGLAPPDPAGGLDGMDIGGHALLRAAIKNFRNVAVVSSPSLYGAVLDEMEENSCSLSPKSLSALAREALSVAARYDASVMERLPGGDRGFPDSILLSLDKIMDLRYGENPHQEAAVYAYDRSLSYPFSEVRGGKGMSLNNIVDFQAAVDIAGEFPGPAAAVIKHANPCGVGAGGNPLEAFIRARETDPQSAFGGIIAVNAKVDARLAEEVRKAFYEGIAAPGYEEAALSLLKKKKRLRIVRHAPGGAAQYVYRSAGPSLLVQEADGGEDEAGWKVVTEREPTDSEMGGLRFVWKVVRHVKSNAIVIGNAVETIGIGAGQMSRVDSCELALKKARKNLDGSALASDGFFPFRDSIDLAAENGITAVIQPGGSIRDGEVIDACNERGIAMVFTGRRHFLH